MNYKKLKIIFIGIQLTLLLLCFFYRSFIGFYALINGVISVALALKIYNGKIGPAFVFALFMAGAIISLLLCAIIFGFNFDRFQ
ncbi:hypothetical protein SAMN05216297_10196 [Flavobacterium phragmitis]|uniref:Uncharacterized protein n=1 Tax=Flavobacterium phragmitis TaxID=739143 RepID=A0A1I1JTU1_9FLAO|nr:hypothetical protein SAMN05216297_10196 [Flavobacterium phragmitis]